MTDFQVLVDKQVLDHQLIDCNGRRCGNVDNLELTGAPGERLVVTAILSGPGEFRTRLPRVGRPLAWFLTRLFGDSVTRTAWSEVSGHEGAIQLHKDAKTYGLGAGDDKVGRLIAKIPGA
jgi:hypothetical protein